MSSISSSGQDSVENSWKNVEDVFEEYDLQDTDYVKEQLEFMDSVAVGYPDGTEMLWEEEAPEQYEALVESFGEVEEYVSHLDDGSVAVFVKQEDEPLFAVYGEEQGGYRQSRFGLSMVANTLSQ